MTSLRHTSNVVFLYSVSGSVRTEIAQGAPMHAPLRPITVNRDVQNRYRSDSLKKPVFFVINLLNEPGSMSKLYAAIAVAVGRKTAFNSTLLMIDPCKGSAFNHDLLYHMRFKHVYPQA